MPFLRPVIDHVVINVASGLDEAAAEYGRLGFSLTERGHHSLGSSNHLAIFGQDYLELLGVEPGREASRVDFLQHPTGLAGLVFKPPADPGFAASLRARGIQVEDPREFHRPVRTSEGVGEARFRTATLSDPRVQNGRVFFCHHFTPELVWRDEWRGHANGATGLAEFVIAAADPARAAGLYRELFGDDAVAATEGGYAVPADTASVLILSPEAVRQRFGDAAPVQADGTDRMVALGIRVRDLGATARLLSENAIAGLSAREDRVLVPAASAAGLALAFLP
ncbi:VOC family protein [Roseomonas indoligenes]|uniref:VOC family protein n=1 Tax=Roseomonas indoligenes TaxID=2820811 RepID=A0A940N7J6_9PROT|nr:VOC family protein [Pararoseomonas indoligenes]MBP0495532.1 VOC family protein [Pararoseomonas indoligenes]